MSLSTLDKSALNDLGTTIPELSIGYNSLPANVQVGDAIDNAGRSGTFTATGGTTSVVADTNIQAGDQVFLQAQDTAAATLSNVFVDPSAIVVGVSFTVTTSSAAGTEVFAYLISR